jgi:hypothetical protein
MVLFTNSYSYRILIIVEESALIYHSEWCECRTFTSIMLVYSSKLSKRFWAFWHEVGSRGIGCHPTNKSHIEI